jgi:hypothetical protein
VDIAPALFLCPLFFELTWMYKADALAQQGGGWHLLTYEARMAGEQSTPCCDNTICLHCSANLAYFALTLTDIRNSAVFWHLGIRTENE